MKLLRILVSAFLAFGVACVVYATEPRVHQVQSQGVAKNGWHIANSTEGGFKVEMPSPFNDFTIEDKDGTVHILSAPDRLNSKFIAMFAPKGKHEGIRKAFEAALEKTVASPSTFRGFPSVVTRDVLSGSDGIGAINTLRFKTSDGIYSLMIVSHRLLCVSQVDQRRGLMS